MHGLRSFLMIAAAAAAGACAPVADQTRSDFPRQSHATLLVKNDNWNNVNVYLVRGPMRTRVGSVVSMGKAEFNIPDAYVIGTSDVTVGVDPIGSNETYVSPPIQVFSGAQLALTVGTQLRLSNFAVYSRRLN